MHIRKGSRWYLLIFVGSFLLFAVLRIATGGPTSPNFYFFYMIAQIGCFLCVMGWMMTIRRRIIHRETRLWLRMIGSFFLLFFFLQMVRYCLFCENDTVRRYMWYMYYTPMTFIPVYAFYVIKSFTLPDGEHLDRRWRLLLIPAALISIAFLTNDFHRLAFDFPNGIEYEANDRTLGPIFFLNWGFMASLIITAVFSLLRLHHNLRRRNMLIYPFIPIFIGITYMVVYSFWPELVMINGVKFFEMAEVFGFMLIGFLEICIQIGLIPSNMSYEHLFSLSEIPAYVTDLDGEIIFSTRGAPERFEKRENHRIMHAPVTGGALYYDVDLTRINLLNTRIDETTAAVESRNAILRHQNEISEEHEKSEAAIRIYDRITEIVRQQILEVQHLLSDDGPDEAQFRRNLARSAVLNAYIKRRSNMELEASKRELLPFKELLLSVIESMEYLRLAGTETFVSSSGDGDCPAEQLIRAYAAFETLAEAVTGRVSYMTVHLEYGAILRLRAMFTASELIPDLSGIRPEGCTVSTADDGQEAGLVISIGKGGELP